MILTIIGLILLVTPFIFVNLFSDKKRGFLYVLFFLLLFQSSLGILTQYLGVFYCSVVAVGTLIFDLIIIFIYLRIKPRIATINLNIENIILNLKKSNWVSLIVIIISLLSFYQVHYNYTGKANLVIDDVNTYHEVKNMRYEYPYFSDEWYAVSLISGSIKSHGLPIVNILADVPFLNLEIFFHSFIAEIVLILGLNCLTQYAFLSIFINTLIVFLIYLFLRINKISNLGAGICSLFTLYITCGANLPGLWNLMPFNLGILFSLIAFCFMSLGILSMSLLATIVTILFYPPLAIFSLIGFLVFLCDRLVKSGKKPSVIIGYIAILSCFSFVLFFIAKTFPLFLRFIDFSFSKIFFISLVTPYIPRINPLNVIPFVPILLALFGVYYVYREKKWLFFEFILGIIMWAVYSNITSRFFIEYERIAIFVSLITILISGFGLKVIEEQSILRFNGKVLKLLKLLEIIILVVFLFLVPFYTQSENWMKIILINPVNNMKAYPKAPANNYLTEWDVEVFKDIKNKIFLSLPWKGLTVGVATGNYPIVAKEGTILVGNVDVLNNFLKSDCAGKTSIAKKYGLDYIYLNEFDCSGFEKLSESGEGLVLYKFK